MQVELVTSETHLRPANALFPKVIPCSVQLTPTVYLSALYSKQYPPLQPQTPKMVHCTQIDTTNKNASLKLCNVRVLASELCLLNFLKHLQYLHPKKEANIF